jgi:Ni/Co efflux regulator RcnB
MESNPFGAYMNLIHKALAMASLAAILSGGTAFAADDHHDNHQYVKHQEWKKGYHMQHADWDRGERVDWHQYHLHQPPSGYEWRLVDGNYVMAAVATGVIASVVLASSVH